MLQPADRASGQGGPGGPWPTQLENWTFANGLLTRTSKNIDSSN